MILLYIWLGFILISFLGQIISKFVDDEDVAVGIICLGFLAALFLSMLYISLLIIKSVLY